MSWNYHSFTYISIEFVTLQLTSKSGSYILLSRYCQNGLLEGQFLERALTQRYWWSFSLACKLSITIWLYGKKLSNTCTFQVLFLQNGLKWPSWRPFCYVLYYMLTRTTKSPHLLMCKFLSQYACLFNVHTLFWWTESCFSLCNSTFGLLEGHFGDSN